MSTSQAFRQKWVHKLRNLGVTELSAALLEAISAVTLIFAQFIHVGQPIVTAIVPSTRLEGLLELLEDQGAYQAFIHALREEPQG